MKSAPGNARPSLAASDARASGADGPPSRVLHLQWSRQFPGTAEQAAGARHWMQALLPSCPARDDLLTIAGELTANAVTHTRSRHPSRTFSIEVSWSPELVRLMVGDQGSPTPPVLVTDADGTCGRGLFLVNEMALQWGVLGGSDGRRVWADVRWDRDSDPVAAVLAVLCHQFPGTHAWYGASSGKWRAALPTGDGDDVLSADTPARLNRLLTERIAILTRSRLSP